MPSYEMQCPSCNHEEELTQSIHDELPRVCPSCGQEGYQQLFGQPRLSDDFAIVKGEPTTLGAQAEANARRLGKELYQKKLDELVPPEQQKAKTPFWRKEGTKPLDVRTVKDVGKYILTGDKS